MGGTFEIDMGIGQPAEPCEWGILKNTGISLNISLNNGPGVYYLYSLPAPGVKLRQAFI